MPFQDPTEPRYRGEGYRITFRDAVPDTGVEYRTYFHVTLDLASAPQADTEAAFQRLLDLVNASPDFEQVNASRTGEVTETVTPTGTGGV
ncbi:hypothetical protein ACLIYP_05635 [Streptomyces nanhaiensis]|uniref:hypothetical protein n=1 Tax=Streptomyces nanhaiensis TaxID=679319 RepID=UPI00399D4D82